MLKSSLSWLLAVAAILSSVASQTHGVEGDLFVFSPGLGACGIINNDQQIVASVSSVVFNAFPNATANPNNNPICKRKILITSADGSKTVTAPIVDFYVAKSIKKVGLSSPGFSMFGNVTKGIIPNVTWSIM